MRTIALFIALILSSPACALPRDDSLDVMLQIAAEHDDAIAVQCIITMIEWRDQGRPAEGVARVRVACEPIPCIPSRQVRVELTHDAFRTP